MLGDGLIETTLLLDQGVGGQSILLQDFVPLPGLRQLLNALSDFFGLLNQRLGLGDFSFTGGDAGLQLVDFPLVPGHLFLQLGKLVTLTFESGYLILDGVYGVALFAQLSSEIVQVSSDSAQFFLGVAEVSVTSLAFNSSPSILYRSAVVWASPIWVATVCRC